MPSNRSRAWGRYFLGLFAFLLTFGGIVEYELQAGVNPVLQNDAGWITGLGVVLTLLFFYLLTPSGSGRTSR